MRAQKFRAPQHGPLGSKGEGFLVTKKRAAIIEHVKILSSLDY